MEKEPIGVEGLFLEKVFCYFNFIANAGYNVNYDQRLLYID